METINFLKIIISAKFFNFRKQFQELYCGVIWKINLNEIKENRGKPFRVWAKNQLSFEIHHKIVDFGYESHNGKLIS